MPARDSTLGSVAAVLTRHASAASLGPLIVLAVIWGGSIPLTKLGLRDFPPLTLTALRYLVAAPVFAVLLRSRPLPPRPVLAALAGLGLLGVGVGQVAQTFGVRDTSASAATVISAAIPILVVVFSRIRLGQAVYPEQVVGLLLAFVGVGAVAVGDPRGLAALLATPAASGDALVLVSAVTVALYYVLSAELVERYSVVTVTALTSLAGAAALAPASAVELQHAAARPTVLGTAVVLYLALLVTVAGLLIWFRALSRLPASVAAALQYLQPVVGVAASAALFGDVLTVWFDAGTVLVFVGIALSTGRMLRARAGGASS